MPKELIIKITIPERELKTWDLYDESNEDEMAFDMKSDLTKFLYRQHIQSFEIESKIE
jgi:hypothetical protein